MLTKEDRGKLLDYHKSNPNVSFMDHVRNKLWDNYFKNQFKKLVFLDKKYWLILRDTIQHYPNQSYEPELLHAIHQAKNHANTLFILSDTIFMELGKLKRNESRMVIANLIDDIADGVTLISSDSRMQIELESFCFACNGVKRPLPDKSYVMSKIGNVMGFPQPTESILGSEMELVIGKCIIDETWSSTAYEMFQQIGEPTPKDHFEDYAKFINREIAAFRLTSPSLRQAHNFSAEMVIGMHYTDKFARSALRSIVQAPGPHKMAACHILSCIYAMIIRTKNRTIDGNDVYDFYHAACALPYCDAFYTERKLANLLNDNRFNLSQRYGCDVTWTVADSLRHTKRLIG